MRFVAKRVLYRTKGLVIVSPVEMLGKKERMKVMKRENKQKISSVVAEREYYLAQFDTDMFGVEFLGLDPLKSMCNMVKNGPP